MKNKIIITSALILILLFGFLYTQKNILIADDKDGKKDCSSSCTQKTSSSVNKTQCTDGNTKMSGAVSNDDKDGYAVYEFVTDKIHCDACKPGVSEKLMGIAGVKEVNYDATNSQMTNVKVYYSAADTTPEIIAASIKENSLSAAKDKCGDGSKCTGKNKTTEKKL